MYEFGGHHHIWHERLYWLILYCLAVFTEILLKFEVRI